METTATRRIAERFSRLPTEQRRVVYQGIRSKGLTLDQFPILARESENPGRCRVSYAQLRQWFLWQLDPTSTAYHISDALQLSGALDVDAVRASFEALVARHESLRTVFRADADGLAEQVIGEGGTFDFSLVDLSLADASQRDAMAREAAQRIGGTPFDLTQGPLLRVGLIRLAPETHVLMLVMHHIVSDGWSLQIIVDEFVAQYRARVRGEAVVLAPLPIQYADYAVWQRHWLEAGEQDRQLAYWKTQLGETQPVLQLPLARLRRTDARYNAVAHRVELPALLVQGLQKQALDQGVTLFMVLLAGFQALLGRYSGQEDIRVGVPIANRHRAETESVIGFFVNTQVLRSVADERTSLSQLLAQVREASLGAQMHQDLPFEQLVEALQPERIAGIHPLFQVMFNHQRSDFSGLKGLSGLTLEPYDLGGQAAQFELMLLTDESPDGRLHAKFSYAAELFDASTIARMATHYLAVLQALADRPEQELGAIALLGEAERAQLAAWGTNPQGHADATPVHRLIEQQVSRHPDAEALVFGEQALSYGELNARANRLAHHLIALGVKPETKVGIAVERSIEMVVGLLAILKAGGAYVPLDPEYPADRLAYMVADSGTALLLTQSHLSVPGLDGLQVLSLDTLALDAQPAHDPQIALHGENLAYVIYTSGSTGRPKGAANRHRALHNRLAWMQAAYGLDSGDTVLQKTPFSFDVSVWEFFWPLMTGARLVLAQPGDHRDPSRLVALIREHRVSTLHFVPSMLLAFLAHEGVEACESLERIVCSGEALPAEAQNAVFQRLPRARLYNLYGPTEAAIDVTHWQCRADGRSQVPIGRPIDGLKTCVLDAALGLVPEGVVGELYLGGVGLARGYLDRAGLTAERFVADPFDERGGRLYRTGDLVRWNSEGQLEYLGRIDHQVKVRGFRIELGEIEAQLLAQVEVREAVVVANEGPAGARLVAYVSANTGHAIDVAELKSSLGAALPDYMVPSAIVVLEGLPLNANGKVDRKALPAAEFTSERAYEAPEGEVEEKLAAIWAEMLGVPRVGRNDNFFELGGHSLLALRLMERMRAQGWTTQVRTLFQQPELGVFAQALAVEPVRREVVVPPNDIPADCQAIQPEMLTLVDLDARQIARIEAAVPGGAANIQDIYPLVPMQEGMLFHHLLQAEGDAYVTEHGMSFDSRERLERFIASFNEVIARHDILRTAVLWEELEEPVQVVYRKAELALQWLDIPEDPQGLDALGRLNAFAGLDHHRIDVRKAPMLKATAVRDVPHGRWLLQVLSHHLIDDNTTLRMIGEEIAQIQQGQAQALPEPVPFRRFVAQARLGVSQAEHEAFFRQMLGDVQEPTAPFELLDVQGNGDEIDEVRLSLDSGFARELRRQAQRHGVSAASLFHLAWALVLARTTGRQDVVFGTVLFGRMSGDAHAERAIGMFVNTLPLRVRVDAQGVSQCLRQTHAALSALMYHEHASLALAQRCSALPVATPLFSALLNYRHVPQRDEAAESGALHGMAMLSEKERTNFPFTMSVNDQGDAFVLIAQVIRRIEARRVCGLMEAAVRGIVEALATHPARTICSIELLDAAERGQLAAWGDNEHAHADVQPVHWLIEQRAATSPDAQALVFGDKSLSYTELNARANRLAHHLIGLGVRPDTKVGIAVERSIEMVVGLLGILKAGGAYVPLDPEYPAERLAYMLSDSGIALLLTQGYLVASLPVGDGVPHVEILALDSLDTSAQPGTDPQVALHGEHLAYVIYTSGSTGRPKGAANRHRSLFNRLAWMQQAYELDSSDTVLQKTPFSFDVSVWEFFWPLMTGARLVLAQPGDHRDPERLVALIREHRVSTLHFVPSMLQAFLAHDGVEACRSITRIVCSGEALPAEAQNAVFRRLPQAKLYNLYGPTEAAIDVTHWTCRDDGRGQVPIGQPIAGIRTCALDAALNLVPEGVAGELYLGGVGLARGYLGRAGLTAERFVAADKGERLYRTGDLVRWNSEGQLEYLGRIDHQVKVRGFRIELGEIEAQLLAQPEVREAVVVANEGPTGARLVGYVSAHADQEIDTVVLKQRLGEALPEYMVPSAFVVLPDLPLNANGKVDRKAFPAPEFVSESAYEAPEGGAEEKLAAIWAEVLGVERVGRNDNFFELGGHSLLALRLLERLRAQGWTTQVRALFQQPKLADFAQALAVEPVQREVVVPPNGIPDGCDAIRPEMVTLMQLDERQIAHIEAAVPGGAANIQDIYPLVPMQEGMLFHHLLQAEGDAYITLNALSFESRERLERFIASFNQVIARHDILRTAVLWEELTEPVQLVQRHAELALEWLEDVPRGQDVLARLDAFVDPAHHRIDVRKAPMLRAVAAHDAPNGRWLLQIPQHHMVVDHTTLELIVQEIALIQQGRADALPLAVPFRRFVGQARLGMGSAEQEDFFRQMLGDVQEPTAPFNLMDVQGDGTRVRQSRLVLDVELARQVRRQAQRHGVSAATLFHLAWAVVVSRTAGKDDVVFGTVLLGRMQGGDNAERALGMFINTLPLRAKLGPRSVAQCLREMQQSLTGLMHHEHASLSLAQRASGLPERTPLFTALLNYRYSVPADASQEAAWEGMEILDRHERTNYPFDMSVDDMGEGFALEAQVDESLDPARVCALMRAATEAIVQALAVRPDQRICEIDVLPPDEKRQLSAWSESGPESAGGLSLHALIEQHASANPSTPALVYGEQSLSYGELDAWANRLAHRLIALGVKPEHRVGIAVERSIGMVVGILAILKAGGAYVPLDPEYPADRLAYMVQDSGISLLLTQSQVRDRLPLEAARSVQVLELDTLDVSSEPATRPGVAVHGEHLAYVIYTSGSTGRPKGAQLCHRNVTRLLEATDDWFRFGPEDTWTMFHSYAFDFSVWEIFGALCTGGKLVVVPFWVSRSPADFLQLLRAQKVTVLNQTPSAFGQLIGLPQVYDEPLALRTVIFGGEALDPQRLRQWIAHHGDERPHLVNMYGITETTVHVTYRRITAVDLAQQRSPVGVAIPDLGLQVLDAQLNPMPIGVAGELFVAGQGLARGYLGRAGLTAERFVAADEGERLYRTGDLVRWNSEGQLEYLGRIDHQVKVRGFRIELGEIEAQLLAQPEVREAVVVANEGPTGARLVGYVSAHADQEIDTVVLKRRLGEALPDYMVPSVLVVLGTLPLTSNGKVDRKALPAPEFAGSGAYEAPEGGAEEKLAAIWAEVLGVARVGRNDNFFELGGHSLAVLQVQTRTQVEFGVQLPLRTYFEKPTLAAIGEAVREAGTGSAGEETMALDQMASLLEAMEG
ncbi:non-ribosomal peptide synthetase [Variovorax ginsengisoli]|uniref:Amino acid adenylation domain-containing protein n=1 Tax=Variovorax ginsengisoli TaxID=363844 RepID=A0ABT9SCV0_9BURK|nr:non-ribosomal peptide synthetase [Variovorax ginsengisoli]MDP9901729.1 amino acid adenylation domain-containing protein [Variovorax ginsengisoli]